jgi:heat shock protein HtpX
MKPQALASALTKIAGGVNAIPQRDLRSGSAVNSLFIVPAVRGMTLQTLTATHPSLEQRLEQLARIQSELGRPTA